MLQPSDLVHFTNLKKFALSAAHYRASCDEPSPMTPAMRFGSLVHHVYAGEPIVVFDGERKGNVWKDFKSANDGIEIFTAKELEKAKRCAASIRKKPHAVEVMRGEIEQTIEWTFLGRRCSSRLDVLGDGFITDLKTTNCAEPGRFGRAALGRFAYHGQLAFYTLAAAYIGRHPRDQFIVAVETVPPFDVTVMRLTKRAISEGEKLCRLWFERLLVCEAANEWPGYSQCILDLDADADMSLTIDGESLELVA